MPLVEPRFGAPYPLLGSGWCFFFLSGKKKNTHTHKEESIKNFKLHTVKLFLAVFRFFPCHSLHTHRSVWGGGGLVFLCLCPGEQNKHHQPGRKFRLVSCPSCLVLRALLCFRTVTMTHAMFVVYAPSLFSLVCLHPRDFFSFCFFAL